MAEAQKAGEAISDIVIAAFILALGPCSIGGVSVRARSGPDRDEFVALVRRLLRPGQPIRRLPSNIADDRLLGGLDLTATLQTKSPVLQRGLLAEASGGLLVVPMAERLPSSLAARLAVVLDTGELIVERDGFGATAPAQFAVLALDEGVDDEHPPRSLLDRLAIHLDFSAVSHHRLFEQPFSDAQLENAWSILADVRAGEHVTRALCQVADELGVMSIRAPMLAIKVARIHAALNGRLAANEGDTIVAARLVLLPRATKLPAAEPQETQETEEPEPQRGTNSEGNESEPQNDDAEQQESGPLADLVLEAIAAAIPAGLLNQFKPEKTTPTRAATSGRAGAQRNAALRGRPIGARKSEIKSGTRMHLVETLRAAAPWQPLRRLNAGIGGERIDIRREDFRIVRYKHRSETATVFVVDASGSSAMHRLAEAKGAVELLLADCYIRRDQVAMISFRGKAAELILPPTRSLARAKRTLAALPGGGGTPLAAAIDAAVVLADALRRKGTFPTLVFLTDGRANVGRESPASRAQAEADAHLAARACRASRLSTLVVDTSPQPGPAAERLAAEIGGRYLPLPYADAGMISQVIRRVAPEAQSRAEH